MLNIDNSWKRTSIPKSVLKRTIGAGSFAMIHLLKDRNVQHSGKRTT
jgi:hypothetical protein